MKLSKKIVCLRSVIFGYVVVLSLSSLAQIGLGAVLLWDCVSLYKLVVNEFWKPATLLLSIGFTSLLLCWLGWNSTRKKNRCNLGLFTTLLVMSCVLQIYNAYYAHVLRTSLLQKGQGNFSDNLDMSWGAFYLIYTDVDRSNHQWNLVQAEYQCCGVDGPSNYRHGSSVPWSCFQRSGHTVNQKGCLEVLSDMVRSHLLLSAFGSLFSALLQFLGCFCTLQLIMMLGRKPSSQSADPFKPTTMRHKLDSDLQKPLAERRRALESKSPATSSHPKSPAFGGEGSAQAYM